MFTFAVIAVLIVGIATLILKSKTNVRWSNVLLASASVLAGLFWVASGWYGWDAIQENHEWKTTTAVEIAHLKNSASAAAWYNGFAALASAFAAIIAAVRELK